MTINYMTILGTFSIIINLLLIIFIIIRSPNEQSLQENLGPLQLFESASKAENSIDKVIILLTGFYFILGLVFILQRYF
uniref:hypothetical protein n=1 Tax=Microzonia abyssicola TaxID=217214 RepID=UPI002E7A114C|nr:hypothetical protein V2497_pgp066 [Syringoderma abyssicola]WAM65023.1 hypothetical protein [Syringoderma abyssicola]